MVFGDSADEDVLTKVGLASPTPVIITFANPADYDAVQEDDVLDIVGLTEFAPSKPLTVVLHHADGLTQEFPANHSYSEAQIEWFRAGSALNLINDQPGG